MKKLLTLLAITAGFAVLAPATSQARDHYSHSNQGHGGGHSSGHGGYQPYRPTHGSSHHSGHGGYQQYTPGHGGGHSSGHGGYQPYRPSYGSSHRSGHGSSHGSNGGIHIALPGFHVDLGGRSGRH